eukprot:scaffold104077_cov75-Phaeocystis_antarctica.AAC.1
MFTENRTRATQLCNPTLQPSSATQLCNVIELSFLQQLAISINKAKFTNSSEGCFSSEGSGLDRSGGLTRIDGPTAASRLAAASYTPASCAALCIERMVDPAAPRLVSSL